jgi:predicted 3-demethylubiquinone-9 3-methyltransferase (glyoxalase superfamily)
LWFDGKAEEAAKFYTGIFKNSKITSISRFSDAGKDIHGQSEGTVMTVAFEINGQPFTALNGGPMFTFSEAISFQIECDSQEEVDRYWEKLLEGGVESQCGWLKDKFGVSWQVFPKALLDMIQDKDRERAARVMDAMLKMVKIDLPTLQRAYEGK